MVENEVACFDFWGTVYSITSIVCLSASVYALVDTNALD